VEVIMNANERDDLADRVLTRAKDQLIREGLGPAEIGRAFVDYGVDLVASGERCPSCLANASISRQTRGAGV
jgi:hypothetical protein